MRYATASREVHAWLWVDDGSGPCPDWATPYEAAAAAGTDATVVVRWGRSGDHLLLLYTGGTTGMPKGVMWRQDDLFGVLDANNTQRLPPEQDLAAVAGSHRDAPGPRNLPAAPLMHGTGLFNALSNLMIGGCDHHDGRSPLQRRGVPRHRRSRSASSRPRSSAMPSPSRSFAPSTPNPTAGTSPA